MIPALETLRQRGLTQDESEQMLLFLQRWPHWYRSGLSALLLRNAVNRAGTLVSAKDSKFDSPAFAFEMGKARAVAEVAGMLDDLYDEIFPGGQD